MNDYNFSEIMYKESRKDKNYFDINSLQRLTGVDAENFIKLRIRFCQMAKDQRGIKGIKRKANHYLRRFLKCVIQKLEEVHENLLRMEKRYW